MAQPLVFDFYNSIITVPIPDVSLDMQYLIDQVRDTEDELTPGEAYFKIADASGKESLGGGISTAITVRLLNDWRVMFEARTGPDTVQCSIGGGNLVGGPGGNPIAPSAYTQVLNLSSAAGTIAGGGLSATEIASAVWNEAISAHITAGSVGKTLKDAKTKATLASLK